jgi:hypothetical protein
MSLARVALTAVLVTVSLGGVAQAQSPVAASAALFDQGLKDMLAGRYDKGCPELAESQRLDPEPGTLFTLAECERKQGKIATAAAHYDDYLRLFDHMTPDQQKDQRGRDQVSKQERAAITPFIPKLTLRLPPNAPPSTVVKLSGKQLDSPSLGVPLPVDPGSYTVTTQVPGGPVHEQSLVINKGENKDVTLEVDVPHPAQRAPANSAPASPKTEPVASSSSQRTWAYVAGGVGVAGVVTGSVAGVLAFGKKSTVDKDCKGLTCTPEGKQAVDSGRTDALISTIGFSVGAAGLIAGAVLLLTAPRHAPAPADRAGVAFTGGASAGGAWVGAEGLW